MRILKSTKDGLSESAWFSALVGLATVLLPIENAIGQACSPDIACGPVITPATGSKVRVGDTITINFVKAGLTASSCAIRNGATYLQYPDNSGQAQVMAGFSLNPNSEIDCSGAAGLPGGDSSCLAYTTTYKIKASDVGIDLTLLLPRKGLQTAHGTAKQIHFYAAAEGDAFRADGTSGGLGYGEGIPFLTVINPCLTITKECDLACTPYGSPIGFHGTISNTGDDPLTGITVTDEPTTTINLGAKTSTGRDYDGSLSPGESVNYTGSYAPSGNLCGPFTDTITARATASDGRPVTNTDPCIVNGVSTGPRSPVPATCNVCNNPCINATKTCPTTVPFGTTSIPFSGIVTNCGNVPLTHVKVVDDNGTPGNT